ncbi:hypothetical protein JCM8547_000725 [Rhodosporidiobolus lusitaniae]
MPPRRRLTKSRADIPAEVVLSIVEELDAIIDKVPDRRKAGRNVSLVAKSFRKPGTALVWGKRVFVLRPKKDILGGLLEHLEQHPLAGQSVRNMSIDGPGAKSMYPRPGKLVELFQLCTGLTSLAVEAVAERAVELLEGVLGSGNNRLIALMVNTGGHHSAAFPPADLLRLVTSFPKLRALDLRVGFESSSATQLVFPQAPAEPTLSLSSLYLSVGSAAQYGPPKTPSYDLFLPAFLAHINPSSLTSFTSTYFHPTDTTLFSFVASCTSLISLTFHASLSSGADVLPPLNTLLTSLSAHNTLLHFSLTFGITQRAIVSPALRTAFLSSLPLSLETYAVNLPLKLDAAPLEGFLEERKEGRLREFRTAFLKRDEEGKPVLRSDGEKTFDYVSLKKEEREDGRGKKWVVEVMDYWT